MYTKKIGALLLSVALLIGIANFYILPTCAATNVEPMISIGMNYAILLKDDGTAWAWGCNTGGEFGNGDGSLSDSTQSPVAVTMPKDAEDNDIRFQSVSAGANHVLALATDGSVWAWGANGSGQLGTNNNTSATTPVQVESDFGGVEVDSVAAGTDVSYALLKDGTVYSWGSDTNGLLGNGASSTSEQLIPQKINGLSGISKIYAGENTAAASTSGGKVYFWGYSNEGQCGTTTTPVVEPTLKTGDYTAIDVALGKTHSAVIHSVSSVLTLSNMGKNEKAQFGNGETSTSRVTFLKATTLPTELSGTPKSIAAGSEHMLMLTDSGAVYAWGNNTYAQLGLEPDNSGIQKTPKRISSLETVNIVFMDAAYNLGAAIDDQGSVYVWGSTKNGTFYIETPDALEAENGNAFHLGLPPFYRDYPVFVTANATVPRPIYTVTIPATIEPAALYQKRTDAPDAERISTTQFSVSATGIANFFGENRIEVRLSADDGEFCLQDDRNHTLDYMIYATPDGTDPFVSGDVFATFLETASPSDIQTVTGRIEIDQSEIQFSGEYSDRVVFTVTLVPQTEEGGDEE